MLPHQTMYELYHPLVGLQEHKHKPRVSKMQIKKCPHFTSIFNFKKSIYFGELKQGLCRGNARNTGNIKLYGYYLLCILRYNIIT